MKQEIPIRIVVLSPPKGVEMKVQRGRDEQLSGVTSGDGDITFEFEISVDNSGASPNFLGRYAQGPKDARFVYVNSGTYAGGVHLCWGRRAKISLMGVTGKQINDILDGKAGPLVTEFYGTGKDGGPTCASVKGIEWRVISS